MKPPTQEPEQASAPTKRFFVTLRSGRIEEYRAVNIMVAMYSAFGDAGENVVKVEEAKS